MRKQGPRVLDFSRSRFRNVWHLFGGISADKAYSEITCTAQKINAKSHFFLIVSKAKLEGQYAFPELTLHKKHFLTINKKSIFFVETVNRDIGSTHINQI